MPIAAGKQKTNREKIMSLADRDGVIWLDGEMVPWREAKVHVLTHTLHSVSYTHLTLPTTKALCGGGGGGGGG